MSGQPGGLLRRLARRTLQRSAGPSDVPPSGVAVGPTQLLLDTLRETDRRVLDEIRPYTMTTVERQVALLDAVDHVIAHDVPGAFVECGVWRGGSALAMIRRLQQLDAERTLFLYDTFDGMTEPTELDTTPFGAPAAEEWERAQSSGATPWSDMFGPERFGAEFVQGVLAASGYPMEQVQLRIGDVLTTLRESTPDQISLLRLDTDWYESTLVELEVLYPLLSPGGVILIDDYGHWDGCRRAVDEYFSRAGNERPFLAAVDYTCRVGVKPA